MAASALQARALQRLIYTGETYQQAREALLKIGQHDPAIPPASTDQAALESRALETVERLEYVMRNHGDPPLGIDVIRPGLGEMTLVIRREFLPDFIGAVMPTGDSDGSYASGVEGLRVRRLKNHVVLHRPGLGGAIRIPVAPTMWDKATQVIIAENGITGPLWLSHPADWHPAELQVVEDHPNWCGIGGPRYRNSQFASQVLRRIHALHTEPYAGFVNLWFNPKPPGYSIELEWSHGPHHQTTIERFLDPDCGIDAQLHEFDRAKLQRYPQAEYYDIELTGNGPIRNELHLRRHCGDLFRPDLTAERIGPKIRQARLDLCTRYGY